MEYIKEVNINLSSKVEIRFHKTPVNKKMGTRRLKLLMTKLRNKNYLCFPRMDDIVFNKHVNEVIILRPTVLNNGLALHARKKGKKWDVWYERDFNLMGKIF